MQQDDTGSAIERLRLLTEMDPLALIEEVKVKTIAYKEAKAAWERLEMGRKIMLAEAKKQERDIMRAANEKAGRGGVTDAQVEDRARTNKIYLDHVRKIWEARVTEARLEGEYFEARNRWDLFQRLTSFVQAEAYATRYA